ncbi:HP1 family phage holin [Celerinatantimonas sp. MCCC 1A17872]|uniref:HP1 family phage holin n=1 Tax=Celerinatantimonas sp. MCCC 1A17872 TaxID=3177514 RepID=UPI0038C379D3
MKEKIHSLIAYVMAVTSGFFGSIDLNKLSILIAIAATIITTVINWYYKRKTYELKADEAERTDE